MLLLLLQFVIAVDHRVAIVAHLTAVAVVAVVVRRGAAAVVAVVLGVVVLEQVPVGCGWRHHGPAPPAAGTASRVEIGVGSPGLVDALLELVEHADGSVLPDPVAHFQGVDPHGQLGGEDAVHEGGGEAAGLAGLDDDGVHLSVDSDAPVSGSLEGSLGEPVVAVSAPQDLDQSQSEVVQLFVIDVLVPPSQSDEMGQEVGRGRQLQFHSDLTRKIAQIKFQQHENAR